MSAKPLLRNKYEKSPAVGLDGRCRGVRRLQQEGGEHDSDARDAAGRHDDRRDASGRFRRLGFRRCDEQHGCRVGRRLRGDGRELGRDGREQVSRFA